MEVANSVNICQVCTEATSKYKCPKCRLKYCSVACYKVHSQDECRVSPPEPSVVIEFDTKGNISSQRVLFPTDDTVMPQTLEKLRDSRILKTLLKNPHLRDVIKEVDSARNTDAVIQRAMMEPIFTEFADVCLSLTEPAEEDVDLESGDDA
ncbi:zinc finger HIT domain-containing protein 3-like [Homarus americanus]|uniref:Zinc finger HIT domain-containing protein 3-like n=1 Tax=Homarus americanus TaxID=6706 RepID=A0A8J5JPP0_HOMAM|nr:zinc finger HIT domain-containing protein 3-like [Homarus americanus]XP_042240976.1 zinc finger HIT domain-containing protein 3-like [Homarus americanus]XP_042240977.1 zinc finger HIT domain-containing protein 3-like [Homarus americanus]KAG7158503.1 Zinc finger HIT domain-containing protein 3-like [Homarus americanus]